MWDNTALHNIRQISSTSHMDQKYNFTAIRRNQLVQEKRGNDKRPRQELNLRTRLRRPMLYPLSYGDFTRNDTILVNYSANPRAPSSQAAFRYCISNTGMLYSW